MKFIPVDKIPERGRACGSTRSLNKPVKEYFDAFMKKGIKYARVDFDFDEYADEINAVKSLQACVRKQGFPITVRWRDHVIYIERLDI